LANHLNGYLEGNLNKHMKVGLVRASLKDAQLLWEMQIKAFQQLLVKYRDFATNPANEPIDRMIARLSQEDTRD